MLHFQKKIYSLPTTNYQLEHGFIALTSAIVISFLLLAITVSLGFSSFFGRFDILDSESKERSTALAEACVDQAILDSASGTYYSTDNIVNVGSDTCTIKLSQLDSPIVGQTIVKTQAKLNKSYTNLKVIVDSSSFDIISWEECANPC